MARRTFHSPDAVAAIRLSVCSLLFAVVMTWASPVAAQKPNAYDLLPGNTQGVVWIPSGDELLNRWDVTQLSQLTKDEKIAPFFREKRQELEKRFMEAGWRLSIQPDDIGEYSTGQIAVAWTDKKDTPAKPYTLILIADIDDDEAANAQMLKAFEEQLDTDAAKTKSFSFDGVQIKQYTLPPRAGEYVKQDSFVAIVDGQLLASDDKGMLQQLIATAKGKINTASLARDEDFIKGRQLAGLTGKGQAEYFVRPLGFARVIRSLAGKRSKSNSDMIAALASQGFEAIRCVCGEIEIGGKTLDIRHHGYVYANMPLTMSAKVLDFPNKASRDIPKFVGENISSLLVTNWNASEAFWAVEGLVDEIAGTKGVFTEVINGIKMDVNGPKIDIRNVLPLFTNDIYAIGDSREGEADIDSRRNLIALRVREPAEMARILNQAMDGEPDAKQLDFGGQTIWQVQHNSGAALEMDDDFGDFGGAPEANQPEDEPWLSNWAITVHDDYLIFASHLEMIEEAIELTKTNTTSPFAATADFSRVTSAIQEQFGDSDASGWRILRSDKAYRVQYELFRKGELRKSESMLASILDRLLQTDEEMEDKNQKISGEGLPDFDEVKKYLQPGGFKIRSTENGWEIGGLLLNSRYVPQASDGPGGVSQTSQYGTARVSNSQSEANR